MSIESSAPIGPGPDVVVARTSVESETENVLPEEDAGFPARRTELVEMRSGPLISMGMSHYDTPPWRIVVKEVLP
jgi:hypothetical protein